MLAAERTEMGQVAGEVAYRAAGDIALNMGWEEGSREKVILHGVVGAGVAALGGGDVAQGVTGAVANQMALDAMRIYLIDTAGLKEGSGTFNALIQLGSLAVGAATGGVDGAAIALSATKHNYLNHQQIEMLKETLGQCAADGTGCDAAIEQFMDLSRENDKALVTACSQAPTGDMCQSGIREAMNYAGDANWKSYEVPLGLDREPTNISLDQMDGDIARSRDQVLGIVFSDEVAYGAIGDIESRADFFGAMHQRTGEVWFKAAETTSREQLQGSLYEIGNRLNRLFSGESLDEWRSAAGNQIMLTGYSNFLHIYEGADGAIPNSWSVM